MRSFLGVLTLVLIGTMADSQEQPRFVVQIGHSAPIEGIDADQSGDVAVTFASTTVAGWSFHLGAQLWLYREPGLVNSVAMCPTGDMVAVASGQGVAVLDAKSGRLHARLLAGVRVSSAQFTSTGLITLSAGKIETWTGRARQWSRGHSFDVDGALGVALDGKQNLWAWTLNQVTRWSLQGQRVDVLKVEGLIHAVDVRGTPLISTDRGIFEARPSTLVRLPGPAARQAVRDASGRIWKADDGGVSLLNGDRWNLKSGSTGAICGAGPRVAVAGKTVETIGGDKIEPLGRAQTLPKFSRDGRSLFAASFSGDLTAWNLDDGRAERLAGTQWATSVGAVGASGIFGLQDGSIEVREPTVGRVLWSARRFNRAVTSVAASPDSGGVAAGCESGAWAVWRWDQLAPILEGQMQERVSAVCWLTSDRLLILSRSGAIEQWDMRARVKVASSAMAGGTGLGQVGGRAFATLGRQVVEVDRETLRVQRSWSLPHRIEFLVTSRDALMIAAGGALFELKVASGQLRTLAQGLGACAGLDVSPDAATIAYATDDGLVRLLSMSGRPLCMLASLRDRVASSVRDASWAVVDAEGRYDASNGGRLNAAYYLWMGHKVQLEQLRRAFFDPGLLAKHLGRIREPIRPIEPLSTTAIAPSVSIRVDDQALEVTTRDLGGGVGIADLYVSGTLIQSVPMPRGGRLRLRLDQPPFKDRIGPESALSASVWNSAGTMVAKSGSYSPLPKLNVRTSPSRMFILAVGCEYRGMARPLRFPVQDAAKISAALSKFAKEKQLYKDAAVTVITSSQGRPVLRARVVAAIRQIVASADVMDTIVVYLSGHGMGSAGPEGEYRFLFDDAPMEMQTRADFDRTTLSGQTLSELLRGARAGKKVVVLDTCAAGSATTSLLRERNVSGDMVRAFEQLRDRAGLYLLAGCAPNGVSFESNNRGHGLLTYALLETMRDYPTNATVRVADLLLAAEERVWKLSTESGESLGQRPEVRASDGAQSYPLGVATSAAKRTIHLSDPLPVAVLSGCGEKGSVVDRIGLGPDLQRAFEKQASTSRWIVRSVPRPGVVGITARYTLDGSKVMLELQPVAFRSLPDGRLGAEEIGDPVSVLGTSGEVWVLAEKAAAAVSPLVVELFSKGVP